MAAALLTLTSMSVVGLGWALTIAYTGQVSADISRHVLVAVFSTTLNLLAHSLMMFYLLGKGRAVKEAVAENGLIGDYAARMARLRKPVFSRATYAMFATMFAAIIGASVDVRVLPTWPHAALAIAAIALNVFAVYTEVVALGGAQRVVDEVNALIRS
jgi:hypothetical protein